MDKDSRYKAIKVLIETGHVTMLAEIFEVHKFPVTVLALYLGTNHRRLTKYLKNPSLFSFGEAARIAAYFEVKDELIFSLIYENILYNKNLATKTNPKTKPASKK